MAERLVLQGWQGIAGVVARTRGWDGVGVAGYNPEHWQRKAEVQRLAEVWELYSRSGVLERVRGAGRTRMAGSNANQAFYYRNGISNASNDLGGEPQTGRSGSTGCLSSTGRSCWVPESGLRYVRTGANLALLFPERHRECPAQPKS